MKFTPHETDILHNEGYSQIGDGSFRNWHQNGNFETVEKSFPDDFEYYFDVGVDGSDLDKANRNITVCNLTWEELLKTIDFTGFC